MPLITSTINCDITLPDATEFPPGAELVFLLSGPDVDEDNHAIPPREVRLALNSSGVATATLWPNSRGARATRYSVTVEHRAVQNGVGGVQRYYFGDIQVPEDGGPFDLALLLAAGVAPPGQVAISFLTLAEYQEAIDARDQAVAAAAIATSAVSSGSRAIYTATAGQTVFALPSGLILDDAVQVTINGIAQTPGVSFTVTAPNVVLSAPGAAAGDTVVIYAQVLLGSPVSGTVLQVVHADTSTPVTVSTDAYTDTTLTATITPQSSSSKILVTVNQTFFIDRLDADQYAGIRILRDSTVIHAPLEDATGPSNVGISTNDQTYVVLANVFSMTVLDSPNTASPVVYKTQARPYYTSSGGKIVLQDGGGTVVASNTSRITLMEIAG